MGRRRCQSSKSLSGLENEVVLRAFLAFRVVGFLVVGRSLLGVWKFEGAGLEAMPHQS